MPTLSAYTVTLTDEEIAKEKARCAKKGMLFCMERARHNKSSRISDYRRRRGLGRANARDGIPFKDHRKRLIASAKTRAKKQGLPFDIHWSDLVWPDICPVTLWPIDYSKPNMPSHARRLNAPSLDRIIPEKGYVKGNVRVISWRANNLKSDCSDPGIFRRLAEYIENNQ